MKVLFGMALRQSAGFVESLLHLIGLDRAVPNFSTLSRRQKALKVNIPYRGSQGPLHLLIDIEPVVSRKSVQRLGSSSGRSGSRHRCRQAVDRACRSAQPQVIAGSNQIVSKPRRLSAAISAGKFLVL
jgi:hypothetical protein